MKYKKILLLLFLSLLIQVSVTSDVTEEIFYTPDFALKGIKKMKVEILNVVGDEYGITDDWLRTYVEGRLRKGGIKILDVMAKEDSPFFMIFLNIVLDCYGVEIEIRESASLERDPNIICLPITWRSGGISIRSADAKSIHESISWALDYFLKHYNKANPKK